MSDTQGWINLYKPKNISSFQALNKIKKNFLIKKIGHAGTLDPQAEGILPIAVGNTTKLIPFIMNLNKIYNFTISWGTQTDTDDSSGKVLFKKNFIPTLSDIKMKSNKFTGYINQRPPNVSAIKIGGQRAYKLMRANKKIQIPTRVVFSKKIEIIEHIGFQTTFNIECGKGFYIRSLARDLAKELGTFGHVSELRRLKVGKFEKDTAILLDDLLKIRQRLSDINCLQSSVSMLDDILAYEIDEADEIKKISSGKSINLDEKILSKTSSNLLSKKIIFLTNNGKVLSFGNLIGNLFKPQKVLI